MQLFLRFSRRAATVAAAFSALIAFSIVHAGEAIPPDPLGDKAIPADPLDEGAFSSAPLGHDGRDAGRTNRPSAPIWIDMPTAPYSRDSLARFGAAHCRSRLPPGFELAYPGTLRVGEMTIDATSVTVIDPSTCYLGAGGQTSVTGDRAWRWINPDAIVEYVPRSSW